MSSPSVVVLNTSPLKKEEEKMKVGIKIKRQQRSEVIRDETILEAEILSILEPRTINIACSSVALSLAEKSPQVAGIPKTSRKSSPFGNSVSPRVTGSASK